jgi:hypothetical protein
MSNTGKMLVLVVGLLFALMATYAVIAADTPAAPAPAKDVVKKAQTTCPITGKPIDKKLFVDQDGKRIYVCCTKCPDAVKKDFAKIAKDLEAKGIDLTIPKDAAKPAEPAK